MAWLRQRPGRQVVLRALVVAIALLSASVACSNHGGDRSGADSPTSTQAPRAATDEPTTERDYTATTGPDCTVGTIPEGRAVPSGCDRLYSPYLAPGASCIEGQASDCTDPDGDGAFTFTIGGGRCLVERKDPARCRDDDGDGRLDEPLPG